MSKAHDPHWRYIAIGLDGPRSISRRALQNALLGRARKEGIPDPEAPQLTRYAWPHAIVKIHHHALAATRAWLPRLDFAVEGEAKVPLQVKTLSSSGTIKALTDRLRILEKRGEVRADGPQQAAKGASAAVQGKPGGRSERAAPGARSESTRDATRQAGGPVAPPGRSGQATKTSKPHDAG